MSANNGIYIFKTKEGQCRVVYVYEIANLHWSFLNWSITNDIISTRVVEIFGKGKFTYNQNIARSIAFSMSRKTYLEYGVNEIVANKTWKQIVKEAKELAPLEIEAIECNSTHDGRWDSNLIKLKEIMNM